MHKGWEGGLNCSVTTPWLWVRLNLVRVCGCNCECGCWIVVLACLLQFDEAIIHSHSLDPVLRRPAPNNDSNCSVTTPWLCVRLNL